MKLAIESENFKCTKPNFNICRGKTPQKICHLMLEALWLPENTTGFTIAEGLLSCRLALDDA